MVGGSTRRIAILALGASLMACSGGGTPPAGSRMPTAPTPTSIVTPAPMTAGPVSAEPTAAPAAVPPSGWVVRDVPGAEHVPATPSRVTAVRDGFLAIGERQCTRRVAEPTEIDRCYGLGWGSETGDTWARIGPDPAIEVGAAMMTSGPSPGWVALDGGPAGTVLVGYRLGVEPTPGSGPTAWFVDATAPFTPVADPTFAGARFGDVIATDTGFIIVGTVVRLAGSLADSPPPRAAAWWSATGLGWTRADDGPWADIGGYLDTMEEPSFGGPVAAARVRDGFVAVGSSCGPLGGACVGAAWASADGMTWSRLDIPVIDGRLHAVAPLADGFVALASEPACGPGCAGTVLAGSAARGWETATIEGAVGLGAIAATRGNVLAVGAPEDGGPTAWWSQDGLTWTSVTDLPTVPGVRGVSAMDVASSDERVVIVGWTEPATGFAIVGDAAP